MPHKKPQPLFPAKANKHCPVCGQVSYSRDGIHPQCSEKQADDARVERTKNEVPPAKEKNSANNVAPWLQSCPKCGNLVHVRKKVCQCGHTIAAAVRPPEGEGETT